jgi:hypothetical protein
MNGIGSEESLLYSEESLLYSEELLLYFELLLHSEESSLYFEELLLYSEELLLDNIHTYRKRPYLCVNRPETTDTEQRSESSESAPPTRRLNTYY